MTACPLVVDLDGTLIHTDMLHESALKFFKHNPFGALKLPFWLLKSKAFLKENLASKTDFDPSTLPYNKELLSWLKQQKNKGRALILCTASDQSIATSIAEHLGFFDRIIASDGEMNLAGEKKAQKLEETFGSHGFDYVGNSKTDLAVWERARRAIVVSASSELVKKAQEVCDVEHVFFAQAPTLKTWARALRVHQWLKNLLLFIPLLAAHQIVNVHDWTLLTIAFFSFCLCASSVYIANDLFDLESDREHPRKRNRPFAAGKIPAWMGVLVVPFLLSMSFSLGAYASKSFLCWLMFYFVLTCLYSWGLKRLVLIDCLSLAMLYTLRIVAGAAAISMNLSFWLLAFSVFLFLSLSFVKRYAELEVLLLNDKKKVHGRGYYTSDASLIQTLGVTSGYAAVLVLSLYLNSEKIIALYKTPEVIWGTVPIVLFWLNWMWLQAHRGLMHDDPLIFAVKDKVSLLTGIVFAAVITLGAIGLPW